MRVAGEHALAHPKSDTIITIRITPSLPLVIVCHNKKIAPKLAESDDPACDPLSCVPSLQGLGVASVTKIVRVGVYDQHSSYDLVQAYLGDHNGFASARRIRLNVSQIAYRDKSEASIVYL